MAKTITSGVGRGGRNFPAADVNHGCEPNLLARFDHRRVFLTSLRPIANDWSMTGTSAVTWNSGTFSNVEGCSPLAGWPSCAASASIIIAEPR